PCGRARGCCRRRSHGSVQHFRDRTELHRRRASGTAHAGDGLAGGSRRGVRARHDHADDERPRDVPAARDQMTRAVVLDLATITRGDLDLSAMDAALPGWHGYPVTRADELHARIADAEVVL